MLTRPLNQTISFKTPQASRLERQFLLTVSSKFVFRSAWVFSLLCETQTKNQLLA